MSTGIQIWYLFVFIVCGTLGTLIFIALYRFSKEQKEANFGPSEQAPDPALVSILRDDFRAIRIANPGANMDLLNLSTIILKLDRGEPVSTETVLFLLSRMKGTEGTIEKIKREGA